MEITTKNKEEIEKIKEEIESFESKRKNSEEDYWEFEHGRKYSKLKGRLQERIKTSILWCEDEIEFLESFYEFYNCISGEHVIARRLHQLQTHLTWLKEQEKK